MYLLPSVVHHAKVITSSTLLPASTNCTGAPGSTGLCVHAGQGSLPPHVADVAGHIRPHEVVLRWGLKLKNPVGTGSGIS